MVFTKKDGNFPYPIKIYSIPRKQKNLLASLKYRWITMIFHPYRSFNWRFFFRGRVRSWTESPGRQSHSIHFGVFGLVFKWSLDPYSIFWITWYMFLTLSSRNMPFPVARAKLRPPPVGWSLTNAERNDFFLRLAMQSSSLLYNSWWFCRRFHWVSKKMLSLSWYNDVSKSSINNSITPVNKQNLSENETFEDRFHTRIETWRFCSIATAVNWLIN